MLNKSTGNMYGWCNFTWNAIQGECLHDCSYCYVKKFPVGKLRLNERNLQDDLGTNNTIFVGSGCDMWAKNVPSEWIVKVLEHCNMFHNQYVFQTKNPARFKDFLYLMPKHSLFGVTIESNRNYGISQAPFAWDRYDHFLKLDMPNKFLSIEPILDFDLCVMSYWIACLKPKFVSIGADSKGHGLKEPDWGRLSILIDEVRKVTEVRLKDNLARLNPKGVIPSA
jgi:hypothetical protein